ncbi:MAG: hypothetical protein DCC57_11540 [Chloroflexi bacterium]|nr:MAG: hypothetical protein DCC57_11540 [Chloroflexota bacterium]
MTAMPLRRSVRSPDTLPNCALPNRALPDWALSHAGRWFRPLGLILAVALLLAACRARQNATPTPAAPAPALSVPAEDNGPPTTDSAQGQHLVVWLPAFSGIAAGAAAGDVLETSIRQFEQAHPGVSIEVQVKAESGVAALWPFLRSAQAVAPAILPDLVLINTQQLWQGADLGLFMALDETDIAAVDDFYPAARAGVHYNNRLLGIPYTVDAVHAVYSQEGFAGALPTWETLLAEAPAYLFPGGSSEGSVNLHMLAQYLGAGGDLAESAVEPDLEAARAYFEFLAEGRQQGVIPPEVADLGTFSAVYAAFQAHSEGLAATLGSDVLGGAERTQLRYAPLPTRSGRPTTVADIWAFALLTQDTERQALALSLVAALLEPDVQGAWSQFADRLPSRRSALAQWDQAGPYRSFLEQQIEGAAAVPNGRAFADFARRLQAGQLAVLRGELTPDEAARSLSSAP